MESNSGNSKRPSFQPKQLALRNAGIHGSTFISFLQILGTGMDTGDTSASVLLFFDKRRIIFNAGEGLQRFCLEHKVKLSKLDHVFLTRVCSETASGVPGLLLTLSNTGENGIAVNLWGPSDLNYLVDAMRTFIPNSSVIHARSFGGKEGPLSSGHTSTTSAGTVILLEDEVVTISAVILHPSSIEDIAQVEHMDVEETRPTVPAKTEDAEQKGKSQVAQGSVQSAEPWELGFGHTETPVNPSEQKKPSIENLVTSATDPLNAGPSVIGKSQLLAGSLPLVADQAERGPEQMAVVYVCELSEMPGKFDPVKAKALGLRPGPKYGLLQAGKDVLADDGKTTITPRDVMDPPSPGPVCLVVDCPSLSYVPALVSASGLQRFYGPATEKKVACIVHIGPASVMKTAEYQRWMARFDGSQHVMAGHGMIGKVSPILKASARVMSRLNYICPRVFPISGLLQNEDLMDSTNNGFESSVAITAAENLLKYWLRPLSTSGVDRSGVPEPLNIEQVQTDLVAEVPELVEVSEHLADLWKRGDKSPSSPKGRKSRSPSPKRGSEGSSQEDLPDCLRGVGREEMEMVFLGTGSAMPSKYRNLSAIYIHLFERGGLLLDCGEGTYGQLIRRYGTRKADEVVAGLKMVWISHIHADHHTGLASILSVRRKLLEKQGTFHPVIVVGPKKLKRYLDAYERLEDLGMEFLDCSQTTFEAESAASMSWENGQDASGQGSTKVENYSNLGLVRVSNKEEGPIEKPTAGGQLGSYWLQSGFNLQAGLDEQGRQKLKNALSSLGLAYLVSVPVVHCSHAFGVVIVAEKRPDGADGFLPGWKLVYSGDTRPCQALVEAAKGATVLIHEATFDDSMEEEAIAKNHSMTKEAIETGIAAGAYRTMLTHFSQRYPKIPVFNESYNDGTCIAFDMMSANLADLPLLPKLLPALKLLFKDDMLPGDEEMEELSEQQQPLEMIS
ncbi:hypothetical protein R1sor_000150 [Riccia sorocarpa]|uniref:ribonuclease Z n=1 Tax=Riccia sorocarpa TaxID=122646 RepID=A0ABD3GSC2_9MARC